MSGNKLKAFQYMVDATAAAIDVNDTLKTTSLLRDIDDTIRRQEESNFSSFVVTEEEKAKIECLKGQVGFFLSSI